MHAVRKGPEGKDSDMREVSAGLEGEGDPSGDEEGWLNVGVEK